MKSLPNFIQIQEYFFQLQASIVKDVEKLTGTGVEMKPVDSTSRKHCAAIGQDKVFDRYAVNVTAMESKGLPGVALGDSQQYVNEPFRVCGISMIFHPNNPYVPTMHANLRLFCLKNKPVYWFGGGLDLTPCYVDEEDVHMWHLNCQKVCERHDMDYDALKSQCDQYFYLPHRQEHRGVGGLFFENVSGDASAISDFVCDLGRQLMPSYLAIVARQMNSPFDQDDKFFQSVRRGRYVEFNLLYDRGTHFGFKVGACPDSVLVSMPPGVRWEHDFQPNEKQAASLAYFKKPWAMQVCQ
jgi:coproporphyrinogen III oxidase